MKTISAALLTIPTLVVVLSSWTGPTSTSLEAGEPLVRTGTVEGWSVDASGTVAVRLTGKHDGKSYSLWFATPPNRTSTTGYEAMVLEAVLESSPPHNPAMLTARSETDEGANGKTVEAALPLLALRRE